MRGLASERTVSARPTGAGYTLIELLMVLAILGMAGGIIATRLGSRGPVYQLRGAAREIGATVCWSRSESIAGRPMTLCYDVREGGFWVQPDGASLTGPEALAARRRLPDGVRFADVAFGSGERVGGVTTISFTRLGACRGHWVHLTNDRGDDLTVEVMPLAAQVNYYDMYQKPSDAQR